MTAPGALLDRELLDRAVKAAEAVERGESPGKEGAQAISECWRMWSNILRIGRDATFREMVKARDELDFIRGSKTKW